MKLLQMIAVCVASTGLAFCHPGCKPAVNGATDGAYIAETAKCVNDAKSKQESVSCREQVNFRFGLCPSTQPAIVCPKADPKAK